MKMFSLIRLVYVCLDDIMGRIYKFFIENRYLIGVLLGAQLYLYSYLFTESIFTNHSIPNIYIRNYPSFKTFGEGRWFSDLIIFLQGGTGVQSFQMLFGTLIQSINAILFVKYFCEVRIKRDILIISLLICFFPSFLDYYSFSSDHIHFTVGDTFAILGAMILNRIKFRKPLFSILTASILFHFSIACYGPKISLVSFLSLTVLLKIFDSKENSNIRDVISALMQVILSLILAIGSYYLLTRIIIEPGFHMRSEINTISHMVYQASIAYPWISNYFYDIGGIPSYANIIPWAIICTGIFTFFNKQKWNMASLPIICFLFVLIMLIPFALRMSFIINDSTWEFSGRILTANAYLFVFFLAYGLNSNNLKSFVLLLSAFVLYFFTILGLQENNAITHKNLYDVNYINRIASRIDVLIDPKIKNEMPIALIVVGEYPEFQRYKFVRFQSKYNKSQFATSTFINYRQVEIMNYFMGGNIFRKPTIHEIEEVIPILNQKSPWPSKEAVFLYGDAIVVLLENYVPGISITVHQ